MSSKSINLIISLTRSGSNWLSYILGSSSDSAHLGEYHRPFSSHGHIACRLCEANGFSECKYLYGINNVDKSNAFKFAFDRFQVKSLIDCSKSKEWINYHIDNEINSQFRMSIIHLYRDFKAWFVSERRRNKTLTIDDSISTWININREFSLLYSSHAHYIKVCYDDLSQWPNEEFPILFKKIGLEWNEDFLSYWNYEHHGLGGNGASFQNIGHLTKAKVTTGDDEYYSKHRHKVFYDERWKDELTVKEIKRISESDILMEEYSNLGFRSFTAAH